MSGREVVPRDIPLGIRVEISLERPKSRTPKRYPLPTAKPDCDNVLKGIQDALESICYQADQQIVSATVQKRYADAPGVTVFLWDESI
jgi:Holliday junction resolvase RusA-like endonuclease